MFQNSGMHRYFIHVYRLPKRISQINLNSFAEINFKIRILKAEFRHKLTFEIR